MDLYRAVYDQNGQMFEVAPERAADLVLNKGWSNTAPKKASKKGKAPAVVKDEPAPTADTEAHEGVFLKEDSPNESG